MTTPMTTKQTLDREFLELRHRLLDIAAGFDRIERGGDPQGVFEDPRMKQLIHAARILDDGQNDRTARIQMLFSDPYDPCWRDQ